jgi:hypothetical protein
MIANPVLRKMVEFEYAAVRTPLALLDRRLPESSPVHHVLERGLTGLDGFVAGLLATPADAAPRDAAPTESPARHAAPDDASARDEAADPTLEEFEQEREQIAEAIRAEQPDVGELADPDLDVAEVQAQLRAKHLIEERLEQERTRN